MPLPKLPWLDYDGQTAPELVACKSSHRIDSLLCAFEEGIQNKLEQQGSVTDEERLVLAVMALEREVNNGGHWQFFINSSRRFTPIIQDCLLRIHCAATAAIAADAIAALGLSAITAEAVSAAIRSEDAARDRILQDCDQRFYKLNEIEANLFGFVEANQDQIQPVKSLVPPMRREPSAFPNATKLYARLRCAKNAEQSLEGARRLARDLAQKGEIPATETELEGAAAMYALHCALKAGDLAAAEPHARRAFELAREMGGIHCNLHRDWVNLLIGASRAAQADAETLKYLEYLKGCDRSKRSTQNGIRFWAAPLQEHPAALSNSVKFFTANFPEVDLAKPLTRLPIIKRKRPA
jgi:hypothetical protein